MTEGLAKASPTTRARLTGAVYLLFFVTAILGAVIAPGISGPGATGDAVATANNILAHQSSFRIGWALDLISAAFYVALMALFYQLFKPVSRTLALLAIVFGLVGCAVTAFGSLFQLAPLVVLGGSPYLSAFDARQLQALALLFLNLNLQVGYIALVFFGVFQIVLGYLIFRSAFLPRIIGAFVALAGLGWLTFLSPPLANQLLTPLEVLGIAAEASLMLWLLVMGVKSERWRAWAA
ncbi:MAG TPA: DUF4386 domain-containing protein [Candidatus Angelobacter sp.]|nr:DUF4386 domain-containing protein [Candidatus Angelobacter sp.]